MIIDDHPLYSDALSVIVERVIAPRKIETVGSMEEAMAYIARRFTPGLIFLDLNLPDASGASGLIKLNKRLPNTRIAVVSAISNTEIIQLVHSFGASGFISKNAPRAVLEEGVSKICAGEAYFYPELKNTSSKPHSKEESQSLVEISDRLSKLTTQQMRILQMICEGKLNKQIAFELSLSEATVKTHITTLMRKLDVQNRTQAALLAREADFAMSIE